MQKINDTYSTLTEEILAKLKKSGKKEYQITQILSGRNNHALKLKDEIGEDYVLKIYNRDERCRLEREFGAYELLHRNGIHSVPIGVWSDKKTYSALYTFLKGEKKSGDQIGKNDLDQIVDFVHDVQRLEGEKGSILTTSPSKKFTSIQAYRDEIESNVKKFRNSTIVKGYLPQEQIDDYCNEVNVCLDSIDSSIDKKSISHKFTERFDIGDLGVHNILFNNGRAQFFDFEYWSWNGIFRGVTSFIFCESSNTITPELKRYFMEKYLRNSPASQKDLNLIGELMRTSQLYWVSSRLSALTDRVIRIRDRTVHNFDRSEFINTQSESFISTLKIYRSQYH